MDENRKAELQHQAQARLAIQRAQVRRLRQRCIAASVVCFALLWGVVFTQMLTGNDPVLGGGDSSTVASTASSRPATLAEASVGSSGDGEEEAERDEDGESAEQLEVEAAEAEASELEAAEIEASEMEAGEAEAETEEMTTSPS